MLDDGLCHGCDELKWHDGPCKPAAPATQHRVIPVEWHRVAVEPTCKWCKERLSHKDDGYGWRGEDDSAICLMSPDSSHLRAAQPANTDDRQADTIPDDLKTLYFLSKQNPGSVETTTDRMMTLIERTGRAETRIEVLEAALRESREILEEMRTGTKHHPTLCSPSGDYKCPLCKRIAALAAPSGEKGEQK